MSNPRLLAGLAVILAIVAVVVIRSGDSKPEEKSVVAKVEAEGGGAEGSGDGKKAKKKKAKSDAPKIGKARKIAFREVKPGETRLSCPDCNVIVISIDGLRADHMSTHGYARATTPALDKLAAQSVVFESAISQSSWTAPAIASMLTGQLPREHGMLYHPNPGAIAPDADTLAIRLSKAGYRTASYNGGGYVTKSMGKGFDVWKSSSRTFKGNLESARDWLARHGHERFFMFLHGYDLQKPYLHTELNTFHKPQAQYDMMSYCKRSEERVLQGDELQYVVAQYDAGIVAADQEVGKFINFLRDKKLLDNSILIVTSAHGEELFEHGGCDHRTTVYKEQVHVPLMLRVPSKLQKRVAAPVAASIAIKPTVLAMLGLTEGVDTKLDLRLVANDKASHAAIVSETGATEGNKAEDPATPKVVKLAYYKAAVTTPDARLLFNRVADKDTWELYDTKTDATDKTNVLGKNAARSARMKPLLFAPKGVPALPPLPVPKAKPATSAEPPAVEAPATDVQAAPEAAH